MSDSNNLTMVRAIHDALMAANLEYSAYSTDGVLLFGDRKSIDAASSAFHASGQADAIRDANARLTAEVERLKGKPIKVVFDPPLIDAPESVKAGGWCAFLEVEHRIRDLEDQVERLTEVAKAAGAVCADAHESYAAVGGSNRVVSTKLIDELRAALTPEGQSGGNDTATGEQR